MKILAFGASSSRQSINKRLATHACDVLKATFVPDAEIEVLDLNDFEMPLYSIDRELEGGILEAAQRFFDKIGAADALIISFAEHNGTFTAAYKNLYDWTSRLDQRVYQGKPALLLATSPGKRGGAGVLQAASESLPRFGAEVKATLAIPSFNQSFDLEKNELKDAELAKQLAAALSLLVG